MIDLPFGSNSLILEVAIATWLLLGLEGLNIFDILSNLF